MAELKQRLETVLSIFSFDNLDPEVRSEIVPIKAQDGGESRGVVYQKGRRTRWSWSSTRAPNSTRHYGHPRTGRGRLRGLRPQHTLAEQRHRDDPRKSWRSTWPAAVRNLPRTRLSQVVLLGNSGGGALYTFYQAQAVSAGPSASTSTRAGDRRI